MRSSKSDPSRYLRKYRSISQRQMTRTIDGDTTTTNDDNYEQNEMERLRKVLRESKQHLMKHTVGTSSSNNDIDHDDDDDGDQATNNTTMKKLSSRKRKLLNIKGNKKDKRDETNGDNNNKGNNETTTSTTEILSPELIAESMNKNNTSNRDDNCMGDSSMDYYSSNNNNDNPILLLTKKKKKTKCSTTAVQLTAVEIKTAKQQQKAMERKLKQLEVRYEQKQKRTKLYEQLQQTSLTSKELQLLTSSTEIGANADSTKYTNKKIYLNKLLQRERAGILLTPKEHDLLYRQRGCSVKRSEQGSGGAGKDNHGDSTDCDLDSSSSSSVSDDEEIVDDNNNEMKPTGSNQNDIDDDTKNGIASSKESEGDDNNNNNNNDVVGTMSRSQRKIEKKKRKRQEEMEQQLKKDQVKPLKEPKTEATTATNEKLIEDVDNHPVRRGNQQSLTESDSKTTTISAASTTEKQPIPATNVAAQLMASFRTLKTKTQQQQMDEEKQMKQIMAQKELEEKEQMERQNAKKKTYIAPEPIVFAKLVSNLPPVSTETDCNDSDTTTTTTNEKKNNTDTKINHTGESTTVVTSSSSSSQPPRTIPRPEHISKTPYRLPINEMEYEIIDSIRNHDVTIICAETGSGKSTQVPQFLYESNFSQSVFESTKTTTTGSSNPNDSTERVRSSSSSSSMPMLIGVTQPRRVAAVSTAKRVCYEMGYGDGHSIRSINKSSSSSTSSSTTTTHTTNGTGNIVSYQTRYEHAGIGTNTHIQFMTDGILLQEIQTDLLLRKYSVIVLDEAHERNLNTDCLIGLLSVTIPLRKQAVAESESAAIASAEGQEQDKALLLKPLKLVIMSATLRVQDFTNNPSLFSSSTMTTTNVVTVPGRTHPVTIHHDKITELTEYEDAVYRKTCKIHRKLPKGGILVFLTGRQEIVRMVNRLRRTFRCSSHNNKNNNPRANDAVKHEENLTTDNNNNNNNVLRDLDDDEVDQDIFVSKYQDDDDDDDDNDDDIVAERDNDDEEEPISELKDTATNGKEEDDDDDGIPKKALILPLYSLLSPDEQAKVFATVPDGYRLIVVATNVAETSITIPDIKYVVDCGRHKCRNYNNQTGIASYDIMWISKASANQRAGRAGRTGPGHCYRLYSSTMYTNHMDDHTLPELLTRPLEDVVLAMKAMDIANIRNFPFPTPPDKVQIDSALRLLAHLGCVDLSNATMTTTGTANDVVESNTTTSGCNKITTTSDGTITRLGRAVAKLPLGVRCGKIILVAAQANVLDYAIIVVAALSEQSPFVRPGHLILEDPNEIDNDDDNDDEVNDDDDVNNNNKLLQSGSSNKGVRQSHKKNEKKQKPAKKSTFCWFHRGGDLLAILQAVGAHTYARSQQQHNKTSIREFCEANGLSPVIMERIQTMRMHLARLAKTRLNNSHSAMNDSCTGMNSVATKTGGYVHSMPPPTKVQEQLLRQSIVSGYLDHVAMLAPLGSIPAPATTTSDNHYRSSFSLRSAYISCSSTVKEPLYIDRNSVVYTNIIQALPKWICYESIVRKQYKDGTPLAVMKNITTLDHEWLGTVGKNSSLLCIGEAIPSPIPIYDPVQDAILCSARTTYGCHKWEIPPVRVEMYLAVVTIPTEHQRRTTAFLSDDSFRWFARYLLEGKVLLSMKQRFDESIWNDVPTIVTRSNSIKKVSLLVSILSNAGIDSATALQKYWTEVNRKFLYDHLVAHWIVKERINEFKSLWIQIVKDEIAQYKKK